MWLVFIIVFLIILRIGLYFSKTKLTVNNIKVSQDFFEIDAQINVYIFYKFKLLTIKLTEKGFKIGFIFISYKRIIRKLNVEEFVQKTFKPISINKIRRLNIMLEKLYVDCIVGCEDLFVTVSVVTILSTILSIYLENKITKRENGKKTKGKEIIIINKNIKKYKYKIMPEFGKNIFKFSGDLSISFKTRRIGIFLTSKEHTKFKLFVGG